VRLFPPPVATVASVLAFLMAFNAKASGEPFQRVTARETSLRKAPRADSKVITVIPGNTALMVGDCRRGWCQVSWNGQAGYASDQSFAVAAPLRWPDVPVIAWPGDYGSPQKTGTLVRGRAERKEDKENEHEDDGGPEHSFILEIGTAGEWAFNGEPPNFGGTIAGEIEPIENWLELEFGLSTLATAGHTEVSGDLLFKKPFHLSPTVEFMAGAGPSFSRTLNGPDRGDSWSVEIALDWMFWPTKNLGWFVEPTWSVNPRNGQHSAGVSIGLLIGFPQ
jgi:hypothetical protein